MLSEDVLLRSIRLNEALGLPSGGACFGTRDPSRLRRAPTFVPLPQAGKEAVFIQLRRPKKKKKKATTIRAC